ncbi:MAG: ABC transporter substrate-binding protein [Betaproteobacteria bacterium]|nr:MAG: ABC transporter substrate-binding protein [Betaproteobacteria bacterium]
MIRVVLVLTLSLAFGGAIAQPQATPSLRTINLVTFAGGFNLPTFVAQRQGFFTKHGVDVNLRYTPNSVYLITGLVEGRFDITTSAIDNLVAYQEGQGEAPLKVQPDLVAFLGFDDANLNLVALPEVKSIGDLRGKDLGVDALTTGFAFVLREMVEKAGMKDSDVKYVRSGGTNLRYAGLLDRKFSATLLSSPFDLQAESKGFTRLGNATDLLGAYQGRSAFGMRGWIKDNEAAVIGFMRAEREAIDWIYDPQNRDVCEALLVANDRDMTPALAKKTYEMFVDKRRGLSRDLKIDVEGFKVVLGLRSKYGQPKRDLNDPLKYIDRELYRRAFPGATSMN